MATLSHAAIRVLKFHETNSQSPAYAGGLIGRSPDLSDQSDLNRAYAELEELRLVEAITSGPIGFALSPDGERQYRTLFRLRGPIVKAAALKDGQTCAEARNK
jgi:hypothetical protein